MAAWEFQTLQNIAKSHGWAQFISMQNYYNLIYREEEQEMIPYCRDAGVGLIPVCKYLYPRYAPSVRVTATNLPQWSPIARGVLARPWNATSDRTPKDPFQKLLIDRENKADEAVVNEIEAIAKERGVPMAAVATAWCLSKESVNPIVGLGSKERIDQIVDAVKLKLSGDEIKRLEEPYLPHLRKGY